jgi:SAM-dependent methyltransferase
MTSVFDELVEEYPAWWIDALGEHNHIGGAETTRWLLERSRLTPGKRMLDAGSFVGGAAREAAMRAGADAIALDLGGDFLRAGRQMAGGECVNWIVGSSSKLPFADGSFDSVWSLDAYIAPREFTRVAARGATLCLCCEVPVDSRGGLEAFLEEWGELGWELAAHKPLSLDATQAWRTAEADLVRHRPRYLQRYGERGYLMQLDILGDLVRSYELGEQGHGLFVFSR